MVNILSEIGPFSGAVSCPAANVSNPEQNLNDRNQLFIEINADLHFNSIDRYLLAIKTTFESFPF